MEFFIVSIIILLLCGLVAGFLAGLFGIGGGVVMVPVMFFLLSDLGYGDNAMAIAVATSAAVILPTAIAGAIKNYSGRSFTWWPALLLGMGGILGSMAGSTLSVLIPSQIHILAFSGFLIFMAVWMIVKQCRYLSAYTIKETDGILLILGIGVGVASGLFGIGGGVILTPVLTSILGMNIHKSIGISLTAMVLIASGTVASYIVLGFGAEGLFPFSIGYVNILFVLILALTSIPAVRLGVKTGRTMPEKKLQTLFIGMLILLAIRMALSV
ncbi:sulfite exporter TauE/SafE family protein [Methanospirillum hungatei]|uniref:sulfite exporter TauE/SafE family protein n=1 Tax=Methanospirillum hungatei TaxID=2203 RepID=UPI0026EC7068|nr:sulfite exporter TauE/SafE family protein [Methanospirillum hungatei]MCA1915218.1 sulfite exporter TauE/SafE family protein [Methanospirillum hungatei]